MSATCLQSLGVKAPTSPGGNQPAVGAFPDATRPAEGLSPGSTLIAIGYGNGSVPLAISDHLAGVALPAGQSSLNPWKILMPTRQIVGFGTLTIWYSENIQFGGPNHTLTVAGTGAAVAGLELTGEVTPHVLSQLLAGQNALANQGKDHARAIDAVNRIASAGFHALQK